MIVSLPMEDTIRTFETFGAARLLRDGAKKLEMSPLLLPHARPGLHELGEADALGQLAIRSMAAAMKAKPLKWIVRRSSRVAKRRKCLIPERKKIDPSVAAARHVARP